MERYAEWIADAGSPTEIAILQFNKMEIIAKKKGGGNNNRPPLFGT
jgi:hypothetical protein